MKKEEKDHEGEINLHKNGTKNFEDNKNYSEVEESLDYARRWRIWPL